jgi:hypothetical protein
MDHGLQPVDLNRFVKGALLRDILDDAEIQFRHRRIRVRFLDLVGLLLRAHRRHDAVAALEQELEDVGGDEAAATCSFVGMLVQSVRVCFSLRCTRGGKVNGEWRKRKLAC